MIIVQGKEFSFSSLNADDVDRMDRAKERLDRETEAERQRLRREKVSYADGLRGQCRLLMRFLDGVLGDGASDRLGLNGSDFGKALDAVTDLTRATNEERKRFGLTNEPSAPVPMNRAQRRQQKKHKKRSRSKGFNPATVQNTAHTTYLVSQAHEAAALDVDTKAARAERAGK